MAAPSFLPLEVGSKKDKKRNGAAFRRLLDASGNRRSAVVYIGRVPHGFYEDQMRGYFSQFGAIKRLRLSRNKHTGRSKRYAFMEFESPEVAEVVAETMDNYLMFGSLLQVKIVPLDHIHPDLWRGANRRFKVPPWRLLSRKLHNKEKEPEKQKKLIEKLLKKDKKRKEKLKAAGIDYEYPQLEQRVPATPKKIVFEQ